MLIISPTKFSLEQFPPIPYTYHLSWSARVFLVSGHFLEYHFFSYNMIKTTMRKDNWFSVVSDD